MTSYARKLLEAAAARAAQPAPWSRRSGSGARIAEFRLVYAPRRSGPIWMARHRGRIVLETPSKAEARAHLDQLKRETAL